MSLAIDKVLGLFEQPLFTQDGVEVEHVFDLVVVLVLKYVFHLVDYVALLRETRCKFLTLEIAIAEDVKRDFAFWHE